MEQKESNFKTILSVIFSCTRNVGLSVLVLYLLYFISTLIWNNWDVVFLTISPFINFVLANMLLFLIGNVILFVWLLCIVIKLESKEIKPSVVIYSLLLSLVIVFGILLMTSAMTLLKGIFSFLVGLVAFVILLAFSCFIITWILEDNPEPKKSSTATNKQNKQLDLFDN